MVSNISGAKAKKQLTSCDDYQTMLSLFNSRLIYILQYFHRALHPLHLHPTSPWKQRKYFWAFYTTGCEGGLRIIFRWSVMNRTIKIKECIKCCVPMLSWDVRFIRLVVVLVYLLSWTPSYYLPFRIITFSGMKSVLKVFKTLHANDLKNKYVTKTIMIRFCDENAAHLSLAFNNPDE